MRIVFDTFGAGNRLDRHPEVRFAHHWLPHAPASRLKTSRVLKRIRAVAATSPLFRGNHEDGGSVAVDQREWRCRRYAVEGVAKERDEAFRVHVFAAEEAVEPYSFSKMQEECQGSIRFRSSIRLTSQRNHTSRLVLRPVRTPLT